MRRRVFVIDDIPKFVSDSGTVYRANEIYKGTSTTTKYQNCIYMETFEAPNCAFASPFNTTSDMFSGCTNLKSIKMPLAQSFGHYVFNGLPNLEYLQLGSVGNPFTGGGYFRKSDSGYTIGSDVGLTIEIYVESYVDPGTLFTIGLAENTIAIVRSSVTGEIITE